MKGKLLKTKSDIHKIQRDTEMICLRFRPSALDAVEIVKRAPRLKYVIMSAEAHLYTMGTKTQQYLEKHNIKLNHLKNRRVQKVNEEKVLTDIVINVESE